MRESVQVANVHASLTDLVQQHSQYCKPLSTKCCSVYCKVVIIVTVHEHNTFYSECESMSVCILFSNTEQFMEFDTDNSGDIGKINCLLVCGFVKALSLFCVKIVTLCFTHEHNIHVHNIECLAHNAFTLSFCDNDVFSSLSLSLSPPPLLSLFSPLCLPLSPFLSPSLLPLYSPPCTHSFFTHN